MMRMEMHSMVMSSTSLGGRGRGGGAVRKGAWSQEEDLLLRKCIEKYGEGKWRQVPLKAGLNRCRKSCRLRWLNYLHPNIKRGEFTSDEVDLIVRMHKLLGNRWSLIAGRLPGRTANDIKNYCNTHLKKMLLSRHHYHHHHNNQKDQQLKAAADHDHENMIRIIKPKAIKVLKPLPRTFSSRKKLSHHHHHHQQQHFKGGRGWFISTNSTSAAAAAAAATLQSSHEKTNIRCPNINHSDADADAEGDEEKEEEETSDLLLTSFGEELINSFCGNDEAGDHDMELMNNKEHWDDDDLHLDDNLWRLLEIEQEIIM